MALAALATDGVEDEIEEVRSILGRRYRALRRALDAASPDLLRALPFNSGCFALLELPDGVDAEAVRQRLLAEFDTGVVSSPPRYVRVAYCSVAEDAIPELVKRIESGSRGRDRRGSKRDLRLYDTGIDRIPVAFSVSVRSSSAMARLERVALAASSWSSSVSAYLASSCDPIS